MLKLLYVVIGGACLCTRASAQLSGSVAVPGTYSSIATLLSDLNTNGTSAALTVNIAAGYTETALSGGFTLSASGSATAPITFKKQGSGNNPVIFAYTGNKTPGSAMQDGLWRLSGCDYITIDGIDLFDGNTTNPSTMEFGYGLFKANSSDGCQQVTIKNCVITLNRSNNSAGSGPAADGSRGIDQVNALMSSHNTSLAVTTSAGAHSYNRFFSNRIQNCNIGISLAGFISASNFSLCDVGNQIGSGVATGNTIVNFGGGGNNGSIGIRAFGQYDIIIAKNLINNDDGPGSPHPATLRGIQIGSAQTAAITVIANTISVHGGATGSNLSCIENAGGNNGGNNTVLIKNNLLVNSTYNTAINGSFYGIWNSGSPAVLSVKNNTLNNNSSVAGGGSNYLIYNNGAVGTLVSIDSNQVSFTHRGAGTYSGTLYGIYNTAAAASSTVVIRDNRFRDFIHEGGAGIGPIYFIYNTADVNCLEFSRNRWQNLAMKHSGAEYFIYNSSATNSLLTVSSNSVLNHTRNAPSANMYIYYGAATAPATATHIVNDNLISGVSSTVSGSGNFYGLYCAEGNTTPYPLKIITGNTVNAVSMQGSGNFYGIYATDLGDGGSASGSVVGNNVIQGCEFADACYGIYCSSPTSPAYSSLIRKNIIRGIVSFTGTAYGAYSAANNAGSVFTSNKISNVSAIGASGTAHGLYCASTSTTDIVNNIIGNIEAPASGGANRCNGIYVNSGTLANVYHNSVWISAASTGSNFGCNALYVSSTAGLILKNNLLVNTSTVTGTGLAAAYRRSSTSLSNYNSASGNNLFYAGTPSAGHPLLYNGNSYNTLAALQTFVSPREANSVSQMPVFKSLNPLSPYYLHPVTYSVSAIESAALTTSVLIDYDDEIRAGISGYPGSGAAPDIGADEFETFTLQCSGVSAASIPVTCFTVCAGQTVALVASSVTPGSGLQHAWKMGGAPGGPYTVTASTSSEYFSGLLSPGNYFFILETVCASASSTIASAEVSLTVKPLPSSNAIAQSTFVCAGDTIKLSVVGSTNALYNWTGPAGYYSSEQNPNTVARNGDLTGNYFVEVTEGGCTSGVGTPVTVQVNEVALEVQSTREAICKGDNTILLASGSAVSYTWSTGAGTSSLLVSPTVSSTFSVIVADSFACKAIGSISVAVISNTLAPLGVTVCGSASQATLKVLAYQNSYIEWYDSPSSSSVLTTGNSVTIPALTNSTLYAQATALWASNLLAPMSGTLPITGIMFDLVALSDLRLSGIDIHLPSTGAYSVELWFHPGSMVAASTSSIGWMLAGSATVTGSGLGQITALPIDIDIAIVSIQTLGVFVSVKGGSMTGSSVGSVQAAWNSNSDVILKTGNSGNYFNCTNTGVGFNGQLRYERELCTSSLVPVQLLVSFIPTLVVTASPSLICPGKGATLTANGASSYSWSGGGTNSLLVVHPATPKTYTVRGSNVHGCVEFDSVTIGLLPLPNISVIANSTLVCPSSQVTLSASGANSFVWNTGANGSTVAVTPASETTYTAFGTGAEGCVGTSTVAVRTKTVPVVKIQQSADTICPFQAVVLKASGAQTYTWVPGQTIANTTTVFPQVDAVYNAIGTSVNSCTNIGYAFVFVDPCTDVPFKYGPLKRSVIYPNPSKGIFSVYLRPGPKSMSLLNSLGKSIWHGNSSLMEENVDLSLYAPGIYCLIINYSGYSEIFRLVKE
jgi:hypothetical protein